MPSDEGANERNMVFGLYEPPDRPDNESAIIKPKALAHPFPTVYGKRHLAGINPVT